MDKTKRLPPRLKKAADLLDRASTLIAQELANTIADTTVHKTCMADACSATLNARRQLFYIESSVATRARMAIAGTTGLNRKERRARKAG